MLSGKTRFPDLDPALRRSRLELANPGVLPAVLDTDTFNEIDDQFALCYLMLSPGRFEPRAVTAAPFFNSRSTSPADGMAKSYDEILRVLELLHEKRGEFVWRGSETYLPDRDTPVESAAARRIVELARQAAGRGEVLYVLAIGAITNVASALLMDPAIIGSIVIVWLGGHAYNHPSNREFNLYQDVPAAQVVFDSGVPLVHVPCCGGAAEQLGIRLPELEEQCAVSGPIGRFLYERTRDYIHGDRETVKVIWDIATVACFDIPDAVTSEVIEAPRLADDSRWEFPGDRHEIRVIHAFDRDRVFRDLFYRIAAFAARR